MRDDQTYCLFDESELQLCENRSAPYLVIHKRSDRTLSKEQRSFNRLTKRIAKLEKQIDAERRKLDGLLATHSKQVRPLEKAVAGRQIELAKALAASSERLRFRKRQKARLRPMIVGLCDEAFSVGPPDAETEAFYDGWAETTYKDELRAQTEDFKQALADEVYMAFGVDVDVECPGAADSPENLEAFMHQLHEKLKAAEPERGAGRHRRKKTPRQLEKEARAQAQEAAAKKTVRGIYLSLAKILHPDTVPDPEERARREQFMKQATSAYREGDLRTLLELELEWITRDGDRLSALPDETLNLYIRALKNQVAELEQTLRRLPLDPCYVEIRAITTMSEPRVRTLLRERAAILEMGIADLEKDIEHVSTAKSSGPIMSLVRDYIEDTRVDQWAEDLTDWAFRGPGPLR
jgi:hypothetical protein